MRRHLQEQVDTYGDQTLVNLVNQKGYEKPIKEAYERFVAEVCCYFLDLLSVSYFADHKVNMPNVHYEYFDFHTECSKMRWDRVSILLERIKEDLERQG